MDHSRRIVKSCGSQHKKAEKPFERAKRLMEEHALCGKRLDGRHLKDINKALIHEESAVRIRGITALMGVKDPKKTEKLLWMLEDYDWAVKVRALEAFAELKERGAVPAIIGLLKDKNCYVRGAAADALGEIGSRKAIPALEKIAQLEDPELNAMRKKPEKHHVIRSAVLALRKLTPKYHCMMGITPGDRAEMIEHMHGP